MVESMNRSAPQQPVPTSSSFLFEFEDGAPRPGMVIRTVEMNDDDLSTIVTLRPGAFFGTVDPEELNLTKDFNSRHKKNLVVPTKPDRRAELPSSEGKTKQRSFERMIDDKLSARQQQEKEFSKDRARKLHKHKRKTEKRTSEVAVGIKPLEGISRTRSHDPSESAPLLTKSNDGSLGSRGAVQGGRESGRRMERRSSFGSAVSTPNLRNESATSLGESDRKSSPSHRVSKPDAHSRSRRSNDDASSNSHERIRSKKGTKEKLPRRRLVRRNSFGNIVSETHQSRLGIGNDESMNISRHRSSSRKVIEMVETDNLQTEKSQSAGRRIERRPSLGAMSSVSTSQSRSRRSLNSAGNETTCGRRQGCNNLEKTKSESSRSSTSGKSLGDAESVSSEKRRPRAGSLGSTTTTESKSESLKRRPRAGSVGSTSTTESKSVSSQKRGPRAINVVLESRPNRRERETDDIDASKDKSETFRQSASLEKKNSESSKFQSSSSNYGPAESSKPHNLSNQTDSKQKKGVAERNTPTKKISDRRRGRSASRNVANTEDNSRVQADGRDSVAQRNSGANGASKTQAKPENGNPMTLDRRAVMAKGKRSMSLPRLMKRGRADKFFEEVSLNCSTHTRIRRAPSPTGLSGLSKNDKISRRNERTVSFRTETTKSMCSSQGSTSTAQKRHLTKSLH